MCDWETTEQMNARYAEEQRCDDERYSRIDAKYRKSMRILEWGMVIAAICGIVQLVAVWFRFH